MAGAGQGYVGGFAVEAGGTDDEHGVAGGALALMDRHRVAVIEVAVVEVAPVEADDLAGAQPHVQGAGVRVGAGDGAEHAVVDADRAAVGGMLVGVVAADQHTIPGLERPTGDRERRPVEEMLVGGTFTGEPVESVRFAAGTSEQEGVVAGGVGGPPVIHSQAVEFDRVVQETDPVVSEVGVPGVADVAVAEVVERVDLPPFDLAAIGGELAYLVAEGADRVGESAAGLDFGELVVVAHQDHLGTRSSGRGDDMVEIDGAAHPRFVHDDDSVRGQWVIVAVVVEARNRERRNVRTGLEFAGCTGGWRDSDRCPAGRPVGGRDRREGVGLAGPGPADEDLDLVALGAQSRGRVVLVDAERRECARDCHRLRRERAGVGRDSRRDRVADLSLQRDQSVGREALLPSCRPARRGGVMEGDDLRVRQYAGGQPIDLGRRATSREDGSDRLGDLVAGERRVRPDQPVTDQRHEQIDVHLRRHLGGRDRSEQAVEFGLSPAGCLGLLLPPGDDARGVDHPLGLAGRQSGRFRCLRARGSEPRKFGFDLIAALREQPDDPARDAGDLARVLHRRSPLDPKPLRELPSQRSLKHDPRRALRTVQPGPIERRPPAVRPPGEVGHQDMPVQLRVAGATGPVTELGRDEPGTRKSASAPHLDVGNFHLTVVGAPPNMACLAFEPGERLRDRRLTGVNDGALHERVTECVCDRHRLRDRERQIEPGHTTRVRAELVAVRSQPGPRCEPGQDGAQIVTGDFAVKAQAGRCVADPAADALTLTRVVVVETRSDLREVVGLGSHA